MLSTGRAHNTNNIIKLAAGKGSAHAKITGLYGSIRPDITGSTKLTVRRWLEGRSFDEQAAFGRMAINKVLSGEWP